MNDLKIVLHYTKQLKILYVEDDKSIRESMASILFRYFKSIDIAENGKDGLKKYQDFYHSNGNYHDIVITDINMPKMNGVEMSKEIIKQYNDQIIIVISAHNESNYLLDLINSGISYFLTKPIDLDLLKNIFLRVAKNVINAKLAIEYKKTLERQIKEEVEKNLEQNRLHQAKQLADAKFTSIGQLAAGITHEINTPLTYIKANFEMMRYDINDLPESQLKTRMLEDSKSITDGINRLSNIVESMREMSQNTKEAKEKTNLYATFITALTMAHNRSKQISQIYLQDELFEIGKDKNKFYFEACVQKQRIEQVWIIIINNALDELVKIEPFEKRKIEVLLSSEKDMQVIRIKDNAGGIDKKIMPKIFEPFESTKESSGMGVGLNIAYRIIEEHKGEIKAYNENDSAVFEVKFMKTSF